MTVVLPFENINKYEFQRTYLTKETWLVFPKCDLSPSCFVIVYRVTVTGPLGHIIKREKVLQGDRYGRNSPMSLGRLLIQFHKLEAVSTPPLLSLPLPSIKPKSVRSVWVILHWEAQKLANSITFFYGFSLIRYPTNTKILTSGFGINNKYKKHQRGRREGEIKKWVSAG